MTLTPVGTIDPTPHLYDTTMYTLSGLMALAVVAHGFVKPIEAATVLKTTTIIDNNVSKLNSSYVVINDGALIVEKKKH